MKESLSPGREKPRFLSVSCPRVQCGGLLWPPVLPPPHPPPSPRPQHGQTPSTSGAGSLYQIINKAAGAVRVNILAGVAGHGGAAVASEWSSARPPPPRLQHDCGAQPAPSPLGPVQRPPNAHRRKDGGSWRRAAWGHLVSGPPLAKWGFTWGLGPRGLVVLCLSA